MSVPAACLSSASAGEPARVALEGEGVYVRPSGMLCPAHHFYVLSPTKLWLCRRTCRRTQVRQEPDVTPNFWIQRFPVSCSIIKCVIIRRKLNPIESRVETRHQRCYCFQATLSVCFKPTSNASSWTVAHSSAHRDWREPSNNGLESWRTCAREQFGFSHFRIDLLR